MKVAILSDFHLGYEKFREDAYKQAREALDKAAELADMIIIPGDIFDNRAPKPDVIAEAINIFRDLCSRKWSSQVTGFFGKGSHYTTVPIIAIPGTHEIRAQDAANPVDILGLAGLLVDASDATVVVEGGGEKVAVRGIGGITDDRFKEVVKKSNLVPVEGAFNIFMFHESLYELLPFNKEFMHVGELPKGFDLYVDGHIHNRVETEVHGKKLLIPGSTVLTQLKPGEQEPKGFFLFDTKTYTYQFIKINSRKFIMLKVDASGIGADSIVDLVEKTLDVAIKSAGGMAVIRVVLAGQMPKSSNAELELNDIPRRYRGRAIVEISKAGTTSELIKDSVSAESLMFERMSVRDYGVGVFLEKLKSAGVTTGGISPVELLDILGSNESKDKVVKKALDCLLE